jgi:hypothetical protein
MLSTGKPVIQLYVTPANVEQEMEELIAWIAQNEAKVKVHSC